MGDLSRRALLTGSVGAVATGGMLLGASPAEAAAYPTLRSGSKGFYVQLLQNRLNRLGYWLGTANGNFGPLTQQAVYALQKAAGIGRDGVVGPATWAKVNAQVRPSILASGPSTRLEVHLSRQLIKIVRNNRLFLTLNTSTGSDERYQFPDGTWAVADTPKGNYAVYYGYSKGWEPGPLGALYRPRYFNSRDAIAVHGANSIPPYPASHGCARVSVQAMDMIWARNLMPMGSRVTVY